MRRLDDIVDRGRIRGRLFMKLDVEGSEVMVLRGARRTIAEARPVILAEVNEVALAAAGESPVSLVETLREQGYDRFVTRDQPLVERPLAAPIDEPDIIALPAE